MSPRLHADWPTCAGQSGGHLTSGAPAPALAAGAGAPRPSLASRGTRLGLLIVALVLAVAGCGTAASHPSAAKSASPAHFGGYPSYLPRDTLNYHSDEVLTGTVQRPAVTVEGDGVRAKTHGWSVLITVTGPQVPGEGLPYQAPATTCTWVVTMSDATGSVPISTADFSTIDDEGNVYLPRFVPGQPVPPKVLEPGMKLSFELRVVEPVGQGLMRWAPDGTNIVAKWDFTVEND